VTTIGNPRRRKRKIYLVTIAAIAGLFAVNWVVQVARKPAELFFPVSGVLNKTPAETWRSYQPIFREHSTAVMTPEMLAALAQVEGAGNPVARTYWRWRLTHQPFEVYRPASTAVGMYQITDPTYAAAKRLCIRDHAVSEDCWLNSLYLRTVPSHAVEMTSAFLDRAVQRRLKKGTLQQKQDLAALIHLCGEGARPGARLCGEHDAQAYLAQVNSMKRVFTKLSSGKPECSW
jgi:hypothetical protein